MWRLFTYPSGILLMSFCALFSVACFFMKVLVTLDVKDALTLTELFGEIYWRLNPEVALLNRAEKAPSFSPKANLRSGFHCLCCIPAHSVIAGQILLRTGKETLIKRKRTHKVSPLYSSSSKLFILWLAMKTLFMLEIKFFVISSSFWGAKGVICAQTSSG